MFKRQLLALDHPLAEMGINVSNPKEFRSVVLWLEDQKIRHYKIADRVQLRNLDSDEWNKAYAQYKSDIVCSITSEKLEEELQWLFSYAVRLEYADNKETYQKQSIKMKEAKDIPNVVNDNALDNLDFNSEEFVKGVNNLAKMLDITQHPNHLITLKAVSELVCCRLNPSALANPDSVIVRGPAFPYQDMNIGLDVADSALMPALKILRLLYIQDLRKLQTKINELIVSVQTITANPKTDTKLGKVGR